jgi:hypothetical protein
MFILPIILYIIGKKLQKKIVELNLTQLKTG